MADIAPLAKLTDEDEILRQAIAEYETAMDFKKNRIKVWQEIEKMYSLKAKPALAGRFNVPLPIMSGFIHTLLSKIDDPPVIQYSHTEEADIQKAAKITAAWEIDKSRVDIATWDQIDRGVKRLAIFSGRGIYKYYADRVAGQYKSHLEWIDYYDFLIDPTSGALLENADYCGQDSVWRNKWQLEEGVKKGVYNGSLVAKLLATPSSDKKDDSEVREYKNNRFAILGLDPEATGYIMPGQTKYKLIEWCTTYKGERKYVLFNYEFKLGVRIEPLEKIFKSKLYPFTSFAIYEDPANFWSGSPAEEMIPVVDAMETLVAQIFENRQKRNWGQRAYDPAIFTDPAQLEYRPDGLVIANASAKGKNIAQGIYEFKTENIEGTIDLISFFDSFVGQKTGVTPGTQGVSERDKKVGIFFGELQEVQDRLGLINKSYSDCWSQLGLRYLHGLKENMNEEMLVKMIGEKGVEWQKLTKEDLEPSNDKDFDITIKSGSASAEQSAMESKMKGEALARVAQSGVVSIKAVVEQDLLNSNFTPEEVKNIMDMENEGDREIISEAADENQRMFNGEEVDLNRGATINHIQKHINFAWDKELENEVRERVLKHIGGEVPIAQQNAMRKAVQMVAQKGQAIGGQLQPGQQPAQGGQPRPQPVQQMTAPKQAPVNPQG